MRFAGDMHFWGADETAWRHLTAVAALLPDDNERRNDNEKRAE
jgi:hypothetical protein